MSDGKESPLLTIDERRKASRGSRGPGILGEAGVMQSRGEASPIGVLRRVQGRWTATKTRSGPDGADEVHDLP